MGARLMVAPVSESPGVFSTGIGSPDRGFEEARRRQKIGASVTDAEARLNQKPAARRRRMGRPRGASTTDVMLAGNWKTGRIPDFPEQCVGKDGL